MIDHYHPFTKLHEKRIVYSLGQGGKCTAWVKRSLSCLLQLRDRDAVRRPAARPFVQDAQSAVRLPVSRSRRSRHRLSGGRMTTLWASRTNRLAAGRRTASRSLNCDKHDSDHLLMQCIRRRALTYLEATPTPRRSAGLQRRLPASR